MHTLTMHGDIDAHPRMRAHPPAKQHAFSTARMHSSMDACMHAHSTQFSMWNVQADMAISLASHDEEPVMRVCVCVC